MGLVFHISQLALPVVCSSPLGRHMGPSVIARILAAEWCLLACFDDRDEQIHL